MNQIKLILLICLFVCLCATATIVAIGTGRYHEIYGVYNMVNIVQLILLWLSILVNVIAIYKVENS